jgi:hypothetical protein
LVVLGEWAVMEKSGTDNNGKVEMVSGLAGAEDLKGQ